MEGLATAPVVIRGNFPEASTRGTKDGDAGLGGQSAGGKVAFGNAWSASAGILLVHGSICAKGGRKAGTGGISAAFTVERIRRKKEEKRGGAVMSVAGCGSERWPEKICFSRHLLPLSQCPEMVASGHTHVCCRLHSRPAGQWPFKNSCRLILVDFVDFSSEEETNNPRNTSA